MSGPLPPVPPLTAAGFADPAWQRWLNLLQQRLLASALLSQTVQSVGASAPLVSSGGLGPVLSMPKATSTVDGWLSHVDWSTFNSKVGAVQGTAVLVAGTVTVPTSAVQAGSVIQLTSQVDGGTPGFLRVSSRVPGVSFTIKSGSATDTSTVGWSIVG